MTSLQDGNDDACSSNSNSNISNNSSVVMVEKEDIAVENDMMDDDDDGQDPNYVSDEAEDEVKGNEGEQNLKKEAVQIVSIGTKEDAYAFTFHEEALMGILNKVPKEHFVAVVSVVGAFRTGKSFLLSWFLRYLNKTSKMNQESVDMDWLQDVTKIGGCASGQDPMDEDEDGFNWRGGSERNTTGIWMWSEPFVRTRADGTDMSVLLVDTQGMFDHETTMALTAAIFGLSTLLSSYQIYNVDKRIQEDNLQQLALFSEYGKMALEQNKKAAEGEPVIDSDDEGADISEAPFQNIDFLVRDWQNYEDEEDEDLMNKEMGQYLDSVFMERDAKDLQETRQQIKNSFDKISCFMLTHPGFAVTKKKYDGRVKGIEKTFLKLLSNYCYKVFDGDELEPKKIHGRFLTAAELGTFVKAYALLFKTGATFPEASTMLEATASANNTAATTLSMESYINEMDQFVGPDITVYRKEDELFEFHESIMSKSMKSFNDIATFGNSTNIEKARTQLISEVNQRFYTYEKLNESRNPLAGFETFIFPTGIAVLSYILRNLADMTCSSWSQTCRAGSDALSHILAVSVLFLGIVYATKAKHVNEKISHIIAACNTVLSLGETTSKEKRD